MKKKRIVKIFYYIFLAAVVLVLPRFLDRSSLRIFNQAGIYIIMALSLNVLSGYAGIISLGHAAFFGIGAYTTALLNMNYGLTFVPCLLASILVTGIAGVLFALPLARVKGRYIVIVTLAYCEIVNLVIQNWESLTRGNRGIASIRRAIIFGYQLKDMKENYYLVLVCIVLVYIFIYWLRHSKLGRNFLAIKGDDIAAEAMGVKIFPHKVLAFAISGSLAGVGGALYPHYISFIQPSNFTIALSATFLCIVVVGALGNMKGTVIAALLMVIIPQYMRDLGNYRMVAYGLLLVVVMLLNHSIKGLQIKEFFSNTAKNIKEKTIKFLRMEKKDEFA